VLPTLQLPGAQILGAAFSPHGNRVVTADDDGTAVTWDWRRRRVISVLHDHEGAVTSAAFSRDGELLVSSGADRTARITRLGAHSRPSLTLAGHKGIVVTAAFSPDRSGRLVVTAGEDGTARVWSRTGQQLLVLGGGAALESAAFSPDGQRVVTAGSDGSVRVYECPACLTLDALRRRAKAIVASANTSGASDEGA
jgi:WD40 repeat protein